MHDCTSGRRSNSAVPIVRVRSTGARTDAEGEGREVRCGFCERAASNGALLAGGVTRVMSTSISDRDFHQQGSAIACILVIPIR